MLATPVFFVIVQGVLVQFPPVTVAAAKNKAVLPVPPSAVVTGAVIEMVPVPVIFPPDSPVPAVTLVTVPTPAAAHLMPFDCVESAVRT